MAGGHAGAPPTPAKVRKIEHDGTSAWVSCTVLEADAAANSFKVVLEGEQEPMDVPRGRLYFLAEDPFIFAKRYAEAVKASMHAEALMRYSLFVDSMPMEDIPPLTNEQVNRMLSFALNSKKLKDKLMDTSVLISEVNTEYARTMNRIVFDEALAKGEVPGCPAQLLRLAEEFPKEPVRPVPERGCVSISEYDYPEQFSSFSFR